MYVLNLIERDFMNRDGTFIGYWDGKSYRGEDICYPGTLDNKHDGLVKVYTSKKRAETAVKKLQDKFTYVKDARIETLD